MDCRMIITRVSLLSIALASLVFGGWDALAAPADGTLPEQDPAAAAEMRSDPVTEHLFPPDFVLQHADRIKLTAEQKGFIEADLKKVQQDLPKLQQNLQAEVKALGDLLQQPNSDEAGLLAQMDKILATERDAKRAQLAMLIRVRSQLTSAQRAEAVKAREDSIAAQQQIQLRIQTKLNTLQRAAQALARQGKPTQEIVAMMQSFDPLVQQGKIAEAESLLDKVLERVQPAAAPAPASPTRTPVLPQIKPKQ